MKRKTSSILSLDVVDYTRRMSVDADFNAGTFTGDAGDFGEFDISGGPVTPIRSLSGTLQVSSGTINSTLMTGDLDGTLSEGGDNFVVDAFLNGEIGTLGGTTMAGGDVTGTITSAAGTGPLTDGSYVLAGP